MFVPGPYTLDTRGEILDRLLSLQREVERPLIGDDEIARIKAIWAEDAAQGAVWAADAALV